MPEAIVWPETTNLGFAGAFAGIDGFCVVGAVFVISAPIASMRASRPLASATPPFFTVSFALLILIEPTTLLPLLAHFGSEAGRLR